MIQALSIVGSILAIVTAIVGLGKLIYRQAAAPKGYAVVLTGVSIMSFLTLAAVVALFFTR